MSVERLTSAQNPRIKELILLGSKARERRAAGLFVAEGVRECVRAIGAGIQVRTLFCCPEYLKDPSAEAVINGCGARRYDLSPALYDHVAYRGGVEGVIAIMHDPLRSLDSLTTGDNPLILVVEGIEKPGNVGAMLRTADAAGVDAVLVCDPLCDLYNPNLIRASLGAVFTVPVVTCSSQEAADWLRAGGIRILTAQLQDSLPYYDTDMRCGTALVMGTEDRGLTDFWRERADAHIRIPMAGVMDSLNVSVSAAILCFEAVRQRRG